MRAITSRGLRAGDLLVTLSSALLGSSFPQTMMVLKRSVHEPNGERDPEGNWYSMLTDDFRVELHTLVWMRAHYVIACGPSA